ncbi:response regulator [Roseateles koreensis]|uniref:Response regulator n=1 Tax=Roseateles koreensis TaxID=2987526 RepID=A0ABT5KT06_9BURK|nr:response regulator [Roseateles koreensis]MDC8785570.1 response regulator [Roseateles koreensis]
MSNKTILVVDDSDSIRLNMAEVLTEAGYGVIVAEDGLDGLAKLAQEKVSLVVSDLNMPHMDGITMVQQMRAQTASQYLPVIMVSTEERPEIQARARAAGVTVWQTKPVDPVKLLVTIARLIRR